MRPADPGVIAGWIMARRRYNEGVQSQISKSGKVYLVGAGPGDPGLITFRGVQLLKRAQVVVYDYLANAILLNHAPEARKIYVGKKAAAHSMTQEEINELLVSEGLAGNIVVRLKGGDPFVFGRGGEECLALHRAGIAFEVVPGITSAIAAAAYAGIPVTHRDCNSSFTIITGHEKEENYRDTQASARELGDASDLDWSAISRLPCIAFYMGVKALPRICSKLIEHGMRPDMPAASIRWGTWPQQQTVTGTISDLPAKVQAAGLKPPAITIVGEVVKLREALNWFENRPLFGQTVVVTRTRQQVSEMSLQLSELGARVIEAPTIELLPAEDPAQIDAAISSAGTFDWIVFTSASGAEVTRARLDAMGLDARVFGKAKVAVIGEATAQAVREKLCLHVDLCPAKFVAEALADELEAAGEVRGKRYIMFRADIARPLLVDRLTAAGAAQVQDIAVYRTAIASSLPVELTDALDAGEVTWISFTSSSTAKNLVELLGSDRRPKLDGIRLASIGPITSATMRSLGLNPTVEASQFDVNHVVEAIRAWHQK